MAEHLAEFTAIGDALCAIAVSLAKRTDANGVSRDLIAIANTLAEKEGRGLSANLIAMMAERIDQDVLAHNNTH